MTQVSFKSEFDLEEFIWINLESLFQLRPLSRQYMTEGQICDILAVSSNRQLTVIELKNTEDRYVVQQLTRYYDSLAKNKPFKEEIDYSLPIRLIAVSPIFHTHNFVDVKYNKLTIDFCKFEIFHSGRSYWFQYKNLATGSLSKVEIPLSCHGSLKFTNEEDTPQRIIGRPPDALRKQLAKMEEDMMKDRVDIILAIRLQILEFHEQMREVGRSTTIQYGLSKGEKEIYKTKLCAEFRRDPVSSWTDLYLMLPYPKQENSNPEKVKGLTWAKLIFEAKNNESQLGFILRKNKTIFPSYYLSYDRYAKQCKSLLGYLPRFQSHEDLVSLALQEWSQAYLSSDSST